MAWARPIANVPAIAAQTLFVGALATAPSTGMAAAVAAAAAAPARTTLMLSDGWRFRQDDALTGAERPDFPDGSWSKVSVPHTWNRVGYYLDRGDHINRPDNLNKTQGIGWYRLQFTAPAMRGKRAWLEFDAASRTAEVWLNGVRLGSHAGGFSRFRFDATAAMRPGANLLAVKTDNRQPKEAGPTADVLPLTGDFFVHGGIYRPVRLVVTDAVHFDMLDYGGPGVYATTASIAGGVATLSLRAKLRNDGHTAANLRLVARLFDAGGKVAGTVEQPASLTAGEGRELSQTLVVKDAHLWQGVEDPYLYTMEVEVRGRAGKVLDRLSQPFGIRQMRLDAERGFFLNGRPLKLHGVGMHQDREGKGWALSEANIEDDVKTIRDMGANTIRLTHYQHGLPVHALADRYGLILWDEIPLVTAWTIGSEQLEPSAGLLANARQQLQELIRQNFNHPSVAVWGIANEVDFGRGRPDFLGKAPKAVPDPMPMLRGLNALAKQEDPSRPTVLAQCCENRGMPQVPNTAEVTDAAGANLYFGWYYGKPQDLSSHLDALHAKRPQQPLAVTEYGGGGATSLHTDDPQGGPVEFTGRIQPEEYQTWLHEENWRILGAKQYLWATWLWNSFDFATTTRREGDSQDINTKGLVTYDRQVKKDAFYFYRANWSPQPTVHIVGRRYDDRAYAATDVRVYSNAGSTDLSLNGRSLGVKQDCPDRICTWPAVRLAGGTNRLVATGTYPTGRVDDSIAWHVAPAILSTYRIDSGTVIAAQSEAGRFGSDAFFTGGAAGTVDTPGGWGRKPVLAPIAGSADRDLLASYREGTFAYQVPLDDGRYTVTLSFIEPKAAKGERLFDVAVNGVPALRRFDIAAAAGAPMTAVSRSFPATVKGGVLKLDFRPVAGQAIVSAVTIAPQPK
jgi:beta-galactosidase